MNRREILASAGVAVPSTLAGCLSREEDAGTGETRNGTGDGKRDGDSKNDTETAERETIGDQPCPPYEIQRDRAVCSHAVNTDDASVFLEPAPVSTTLEDGVPVDEIALTLHNRSAVGLTFNPHSWRIWHNSDDKWEQLSVQRSGDGDLTVPSADTHSWSFVEAVESIRAEANLEPGLYAAELGVPAPESSDEWIACIALVRLEAAE